MSHSLHSPILLRPLPLSHQTLLLRSISSIPNPNLLLLLLLFRRISTSNHLRQLLSRATASGLRFQNPHLHLLNSILHSLSVCPSPSLALTFFHLIHYKGLAFDSYTFTSALKAASRLSKPNTGASLHLHSLLIKLGLESDTFVLNSLIHMYSAGGFIGVARKVFDLAADSARDVVSWNSMASGYLYNHLYEESLMVFGQMVERFRTVDAADTLVGALTACSKIGALNLGRRIHSLVVTRGVGMDSYMGSSLISMYSKCGGVDHARKLFDEMPERNAVCWTAMISGYAQSNQFVKAIELFRKMQVERVKPDEIAISSVLSSCAQLGALDQGRYIHAYCDVIGMEWGLSAKNALIDMYSKCGEIERAFCMFLELDKPDVFSWTTMISGLAMNGNSFEALKLFSRMEESSLVLPNEVTFLGVLSACSHGGLIEEGYYYFDRMRRVYKLLPRVEHYGCMVDLLGRAKLLLEAEKFVKDMPIEPDVVIWRSLLFACRINEDVRMAEFAAQRIMELEPDMCGGPVLLSNVYAVASRWTDVNRTRRTMYSGSIQKQPGLSFIELNGILHEFLSAGVWKHSRSEGHENFGLLVSEKARKYGIVRQLDEPVNLKDGTIVLQYEARFQDGLECGGAYLKYLRPQDAGWAAKDFDNDSPFSIMFGPDKCGSTNKVHFILKHKNPKTGEYVEHHLKYPPSVPYDKLTHVYTAVIEPNNDLRILVDGEEKKKANFLSGDGFEPAIVPPKTIPDHDDSKPEDWDERAKISDPDAVKPDDWDEDAPMEIEDADAIKPEGWLDDEPDEVDDPEASKPEDWDDEEDGQWEAPKIDNPKCATAPGCGEWKRPMKRNPSYKGKWHAPLIDNPKYNGIWKAREIPNPNYFELNKPDFEPIAAIGIEIWTMQDGILFDNILIANDEKLADTYREKTSKLKYKLEKDKEKVQDASIGLSGFQKIFDALYKVADIPFLEAYKAKIIDVLEKGEKQPNLVIGILASVIVVIITTVIFKIIFSGKKIAPQAEVTTSLTAAAAEEKEDGEESIIAEKEDEEEKEVAGTARHGISRREA